MGAVRRMWPTVYLGVAVVVAIYLWSGVTRADTAARDARDAASLVRAQNRQLRRNDAAQCRSRQEAREESNAHMRKPLQTVLAYTAKLERRASADKSLPLKYRRQAAMIARTYEQFARRIVPLSPLPCTHPEG